MKSRILAVIVAVGLTAAPVSADEGGSFGPRNLLVFNAGDLINGLLTLEYERGLSRHIGLEFGLSVLAFRGAFGSPVQASVIALAPEIGLRFHFIKAAPRGFWFGPSLNGAYLMPNADRPRQNFGYGFGAAVGYNFTLGGFVVQLGVGGAVHDYGEGFVWSPRFRLGLGAVF